MRAQTKSTERKITAFGPNSLYSAQRLATFPFCLALGTRFLRILPRGLKSECLEPGDRLFGPDSPVYFYSPEQQRIAVDC